MKPHPPEQIARFLRGMGASYQQSRNAYARSIRSIRQLRDKARKTGRKANGYTAEQWASELGQYAVNTRNVLAAYPVA